MDEFTRTVCCDKVTGKKCYQTYYVGPRRECFGCPKIAQPTEHVFDPSTDIEYVKIPTYNQDMWKATISSVGSSKYLLRPSVHAFFIDNEISPKPYTDCHICKHRRTFSKVGDPRIAPAEIPEVDPEDMLTVPQGCKEDILIVNFCCGQIVHANCRITWTLTNDTCTCCRAERGNRIRDLEERFAKETWSGDVYQCQAVREARLERERQQARARQLELERDEQFRNGIKGRDKQWNSYWRSPPRAPDSDEAALAKIESDDESSGPEDVPRVPTAPRRPQTSQPILDGRAWEVVGQFFLERMQQYPVEVKELIDPELWIPISTHFGNWPQRSKRYPDPARNPKLQPICDFIRAYLPADQLQKNRVREPDIAVALNIHFAMGLSESEYNPIEEHLGYLLVRIPRNRTQPGHMGAFK